MPVKNHKFRNILFNNSVGWLGGSLIFSLLQLLSLINKNQTKSLTHTQIKIFIWSANTAFLCKGFHEKTSLGNTEMNELL